MADRFDDVLNKLKILLWGKPDEERRKELENEIEDAGCGEAYRHLSDGTFLSEKLEEYGKWREREAFRKFVEATSGRKRFTLRLKLGVAAAVACVVGFALFLQFGQGMFQDNRGLEVGSVIAPGTSKAVLRLSDNRLIHLEESSDTLIIMEDGTRIKADPENKLSYESESIGTTEGNEMNQLEVPRGGEYRIQLSDGTRVWLNAASKLIFPKKFGDEERKVELQGEAFFDVAKDASRPFIVSTAEMDVKVLGTSFNVSAYEDEDDVHTTLVEGKVEVLCGDKKVMELKPGEQARLNDGQLECREVDVRQFVSWMQGKFMFCNATLEEISRQIERWYDVEVFFANERIRQIRFTGAMHRFDPIEHLMQLIEVTSDVHFSVKGRTVVISE